MRILLRCFLTKVVQANNYFTKLLLYSSNSRCEFFPYHKGTGERCPRGSGNIIYVDGVRAAWKCTQGLHFMGPVTPLLLCSCGDMAFWHIYRGSWEQQSAERAMSQKHKCAGNPGRFSTNLSVPPAPTRKVGVVSQYLWPVVEYCTATCGPTWKSLLPPVIPQGVFCCKL